MEWMMPDVRSTSGWYAEMSENVHSLVALPRPTSTSPRIVYSIRGCEVVRDAGICVMQIACHYSSYTIVYSKVCCARSSEWCSHVWGGVGLHDEAELFPLRRTAATRRICCMLHSYYSHAMCVHI